MEFQKGKQMIVIGIDNGVTGSIGIIDTVTGTYTWKRTPTKNSLNYQKTKVKHINRVDWKKLDEFLRKAVTDINGNFVPCVAAIERPMVNPTRFEASASALRALETTQNVVEDLHIPFDWVDSKAWQKMLLPFISVEDKKQYPTKLKEVANEVLHRLFPMTREEKDIEGLLIAEYVKRIHIGEQ